MSQWLVGLLPSAVVMALRAAVQRPLRMSDSISVSIFARLEGNSCARGSYYRFDPAAGRGPS